MLAAGNLSTDDGKQRIGGVTLLDMPNRQAVQNFMNNDPFAEIGLIDTMSIVRWNKIYFGHDKVV